MDAYARLEVELGDAIQRNMPVEKVQNRLGLKWNHIPAIVRANQIAELLGMPYRYNKEAGGVCIWMNVDPYFEAVNVYTISESERFKPKNVYSKLMIKDEQVPHLVPAPHNDFFYAFMYMDVPSDKVCDIRNLTESGGYDTMTREAYARCHFMPANLTTLFLMKQIAQGHKSLEKARQEYVVLIPTLAKEATEGMGLRGGDKEIGPFHQAILNYLFDIPN
jgi:hypothetical protein